VNNGIDSGANLGEIKDSLRLLPILRYLFDCRIYKVSAKRVTQTRGKGWRFISEYRVFKVPEMDEMIY
jgi:hypothetical protein